MNSFIIPSISMTAEGFLNPQPYSENMVHITHWRELDALEFGHYLDWSRFAASHGYDVREFLRDGDPLTTAAEKGASYYFSHTVEEEDLELYGHFLHIRGTNHVVKVNTVEGGTAMRFKETWVTRYDEEGWHFEVSYRFIESKLKSKKRKARDAKAAR